MNGAAKHPAELGGVAGAIAVLIAHFAGITDADTIVALAVVVGFIPAAVTFTVELFRRRKTNGAG